MTTHRSSTGYTFLVFVFFFPNALGDADNYIMANSLVTPTHIVPEWYFLSFYAVLKAIPNKNIGFSTEGGRESTRLSPTFLSATTNTISNRKECIGDDE